ncbi:MAG: protein kinase domain-containing protein [Bryobacteraceae bacterium]
MSGDPRWLLMKEVYFAALALQDEDRAQYLNERCPDDTMRREVEKLLGESSESDTHVSLDSLVPPRAASQSNAGLAAGDLLGHYRIKRKLGAGGMGWVYEAYDEKLRRDVAIKMLPPGRADEALRRRLTQEAQSASALNHPNIVTVYEVGRDGDTDFIAMERVHGKTLREIAGASKLDAKTTVRYAAQIADALAAAHDANIVHRDLKPGNIMVTDRGLVKVLDFGIAKQVDKLDTAGPTGEVIGTFSYMSPEQAQGHSVDPRSDIFSFGSVLYEMLTGRRAFQEESGTATLNAVIHQDPPPLRAALPELPRGLERVVAKCLEKVPLDRWQHMSDVKLILQDLAKDFDLPPEALAGNGKPPARRVWMAASAGAVAAAAIAAGGVYFLNRPVPESPGVLRRVTADMGLNAFPAISRDGSLLAFSSDRAKEGGLDIWLQQIEGRDPVRLTFDPADETDPAFSPDGSRIAFRSEKSGGGVYVLPALGGDSILLAAGGRNPKFSPDGRSVSYWVGREGSLFPDAAHVFVVDSGGGQPRRVDTAMSWAHSPIWTPGGDALVAVGMRDTSAATFDWWLLSMDGSPPRSLDAFPRINPPARRRLITPLDWVTRGSGGILYADAGGDSANLWELPVDSSRLAAGPPRRRTAGPGRQMRAAAAQTPSAARMVFSDETFNVDVWTLPVDGESGVPRGEPRRITDRISPDWSPSISDDGRQMVYISGRFGNWSVRSRDMGTEKERTLVSNVQNIFYAVISGDAQRVYFSNRQFDILSTPLAGGTVEKHCGGCGTVSGVSRDGSQILYEPKQDEDLLLFDAVAGKTVVLARRPHPKALLTDGHISRNGKWVAFSLTDSAAGTAQLFVVPVDMARPVPRADWIPITEDTVLARDPAWSPSGNLLYFTAERDGFRCVWARRLDRQTGKPVGEAFAVRHFHSAGQTFRNIGPQTQLVGLNVNASRMVYAVAGVTGNIWLEDVPIAK